MQFRFINQNWPLSRGLFSSGYAVPSHLVGNVRLQPWGHINTSVLWVDSVRTSVGSLIYDGSALGPCPKSRLDSLPHLPSMGALQSLVAPWHSAVSPDHTLVLLWMWQTWFHQHPKQLAQTGRHSSQPTLRPLHCWSCYSNYSQGHCRW